VNGHISEAVLWAIAGLVTLVEALFGLVLKMHSTSDNDYKRQTQRETDIYRNMNDQEILRLRNAIHDLRSMVSELKAKDTMRHK